MLWSLRQRQLEVLGGRLNGPAFEIQHQTFNFIVPDGLLCDQALGLIAVIPWIRQVLSAELRAPNHTALIRIQAWNVHLHAVEDAITDWCARVADECNLLLPFAGTRQVLG